MAAPPQGPHHAASDPDAPVDIPVDGAGDIGVVIDDDRLVSMIALNPDPLAPTVVTDSEERTSNTLTLSRIADPLRQSRRDPGIAGHHHHRHPAAGGFSTLSADARSRPGGQQPHELLVVLRDRHA